MVERQKGCVLLWADLPEGQRALDGELDTILARTLGHDRRPIPPDAERCQAASQGNTSDIRAGFYRLVKAGRFFRCVQRRKRHGQGLLRFCGRHEAIYVAGP